MQRTVRHRGDCRTVQARDADVPPSGERAFDEAPDRGDKPRLPPGKRMSVCRSILL